MKPSKTVPEAESVHLPFAGQDSIEWEEAINIKTLKPGKHPLDGFGTTFTADCSQPTAPTESYSSTTIILVLICLLISSAH